MNQIWINSKNNYLSAISNGIDYSNKKKAVFILPGFYQAKCDSYYFVTNFLMRLKKNNIYAISADLLGHGDSYGDISDITIDNLSEGISDIVNYLKKQGVESIYAIGRGLSGNILTYKNTSDFKNIILINPVLLDFEDKDNLNNWMEELKEDKVCIYSFFLENNSNILKLFGTETENIRGEFLKKVFLQQIVTLPYFEIGDIVKKQNNHIFITEDWKQHYKVDLQDYSELLSEYKFCNYNDRIKLSDDIIELLED
ncbi:hypothetical protein [Eubacterium sp.]